VLYGHSDVLVIGAGPAGASAGIMLARAGVDVCVLDRARFPRDKTCGDALSNGGVARLDALGAGSLVRAEPHARVEGARAIFPDGSGVERTYDPPGMIVPRRTLDHALVVALKRSGATVHQGVAARTLSTSGGSVTGAVGDALCWRAPIVIAADGNGSLARAALGHPRPQGRLLGVAITAYYERVKFPAGETVSDHYFEHDIPFGYGWVFPAVNGVTNVGVYQRSDRFDRTPHRLPRMLEAFVSAHGERFADARLIGKPRTWPLPLGPTPWSASAPGLLVTGDAGGFIDPLSGEGIYQAMLSGTEAARVAASAIADGHLSAGHRADYQRACDRRLARPSRAKAAVQRVLTSIVTHRLYKRSAVRRALGWGYQRGSFESTKTL